MITQSECNIHSGSGCLTWIPSPSSPVACRVALCLKSLVALMASDAASPATYRAIHVLAHGFSPTPQLHKILEVRAYLAASSVAYRLLLCWLGFRFGRGSCATVFLLPDWASKGHA